MTDKTQIETTLRALIALIYNDCVGAYGSGAGYSGQYDSAIKAVAAAIGDSAAINPAPG